MRCKSQLALGIMAVALCSPAAASAQSATGTVLQADRSHHVLRLVEKADAVNSLHYRGRLDRRVRAGSVVSFAAKGHTASKVRFVKRAHKTQFIGRVLRSGRNGTVVSLPDGRPFQLGASHAARARLDAHAAGNVSVNVEGLQPGQSVMITIVYSANGDVNITIAVIHDSSGEDNGSSDGNTPACAAPDATSGTVAAINRTDGMLTISTRWGDTSTYAVAPDAIKRLHEGDEVLLSLDPSDQSVATEVKIVRSSFVPADPGVLEADGTVNSVTPDAAQFAVIQSNHQGRLTLDAPCWILNQVWQSEDVHVIYHRGANGDLVADTVDANDGSEF